MEYFVKLTGLTENFVTDWFLSVERRECFLKEKIKIKIV